ncbi:MAG: universal stress protein [Desulfobacterales bacterium]|jgi:nucleotide-binding universal stress UspA family protein
MEKVLLAIDGITPDRKTFCYAVELCKRIKAELKVFQIIRPQNYSKYLKEMRQKADYARIFIQGSMAAAAFAEAGEHESAKEIMAEASEQIRRLMWESQKQGVQCHFSMKRGNPETEIVDYVNYHRDVVLTIYNSSAENVDKTGILSKKKNVVTSIKEKIAVPLVVANAK